MTTKLCSNALHDLRNSVAIPEYDRHDLSPGIVHIGVGNFHRAHQGVYLDRLFNLGLDHDWAIVGAGTRPADQRMRDALGPQDWLSTVVDLDPAGLSARVSGPMIDFVPPDSAQLVDRLADPSIRIVSLTITEGGYYIDGNAGSFDAGHPDISNDIERRDRPQTVFGILIASLKRRRDAGVPPFTVMSCDNVPHNGTVARETTVGLARLAAPDMADWIVENVSFPNCMVDCITPATTDRERTLVADSFGIEDAYPVACEPFRQWVLEDKFPQGRPALERVGVEFVDDVALYELMKLRILNGGHASIAYPSALLGYHFAHDGMSHPDVVAFLDAVERREIIPLLEPIPGVDYLAYFEKVKDRFANNAVADTVPRLCEDGSNRQPKFILPSIRQALQAGASIDGLALEVALWCRFCAGVDENGKPLEVRDELAATLKQAATESRENPRSFLHVASVFGDLATNETFCSAFEAQCRSLWSRGVQKTIQAYVGPGRE